MMSDTRGRVSDQWGACQTETGIVLVAQTEGGLRVRPRRASCQTEAGFVSDRSGLVSDRGRAWRQTERASCLTEGGLHVR
jgi:hypothetical protein